MSPGAIMLDVQHLAEGLEFGDPLTDWETLRGEVAGLLEAGKPEKARLTLEEQRERGDDRRSLEENCWLYESLGRIYLKTNRVDEAVGAYRRAFELEPRSKAVEEALSELLMAREEYEEGLDVARMLLLNHKDELSDGEVSAIYQRLGTLHEGRRDYESARAAYEKALVKEGENAVALDGLLRTVGEVGEPGDVVGARLKLIRTLDEAKARSKALVELGNDWVVKFNDPARALDTFEDAVMEWPGNEEAVERIADVGAELGDWRRVGRAYFTLSVLKEADHEKAEYLIRSSNVARKELWEPEKALAGYRKALEFDPTRLDAFKAITSILVDARDWENLEQDYLRIIAVNQEMEGADPQLLGILWEKLADLYFEYLERFEDAIFAYTQALEHDPNRDDIRRRLVDLAEEREGHYELAEGHLRVFVAQEPGNDEWLDRLGRVYLRKKEVDKAFCIFRALQARGGRLDQKAAGFLERFESKIVRPIRGQVNPSMMQRYIFADGMDRLLNECFGVLREALEEWVGESRKKYGLGRRDRVKLSEPLAFVNFYKTVGAALGYVDLPELWKKEDQKGLINGALIPAGLIVGGEQFRSGREKEIAFVVAKQLFLFLSPFYLAAIRPLSDLQAFFIRAVALVQPGTDLAESFAKDRAFKDMRKRIKGGSLDQLAQAVNGLTSRSNEVVLGPWVEAIEDTANRIGLLFCDDLRVAEKCIREEPKSISQRNVEQRMKALIDYSISEKYLALRPQVGISVA